MTDTVNKQALDIIASRERQQREYGHPMNLEIARELRAIIQDIKELPPTPSTPVQGYREALETAFALLEEHQPPWYLRGHHNLIRQALSQTDIQPSGVQLRESVQWFAGQMEETLRRNEHKGGWDHCSDAYLWEKLEEEVEELRQHYPRYDRPGERDGIAHEASDVANIVMMLADNACRPGINSTEDDQPRPKRHATKRYAIKLGNEYLRERFGDDCFTDDLGHAFLFFYRRLAEDWRRGDERIVEIEVDEEGGLYDPSTEEEETE